MNKKINHKKYLIEIIIFIIGMFAIHIFLFSNAFKGTVINSKNASEYGSFIGGYLGSIFMLASILLLIITIKDQRNYSEIQLFENRFFLLIDLHSKNVENIGISDFKGKKVFVLLIREFREILKIAKTIFIDFNQSDLINISYLALYFGLGPNSTRILKNYLKKYDEVLVKNFLHKLETEKLMIKEKRDFKYIPFEGHQSRLGHYYRHLFQTVTFVDNKKLDIDKYSYIKILRAQLSNHEQVLLAINTLSDLGKKWKEQKLISKYKLIKNIPKGFFNTESEFYIIDYK